MSPTFLMLNFIEPPWYGPVCPVVWEGRSREAPPYPDLRARSRHTAFAFSLVLTSGQLTLVIGSATAVVGQYQAFAPATVS